MGGGLAFLTKKSFNPANISNQKNVWEVQQRKKLEADKTRERQLQLQRERDHEELERARGGDGQGDRATLSFMYDLPPGFHNPEEEEEKNAITANLEEKNLPPKEPKNDFQKRQEGDDDAAAMFRQMFTNSNSENVEEKEIEASTEFGTSVVLSGSTFEIDKTMNDDVRTQLEKAAGIRNRLIGNTLEEQVARFPQLKNAPMAKGMKTSDINVQFNPLGAQIRNVRCLKCGVWGHSRGERECKLSGWNPFSINGPNSLSDKNYGKTNAADPKYSKKSDSSIHPEEKKVSSKNFYNNEQMNNRNDEQNYHSDSSRRDASRDSMKRRRREKKHYRSRDEKMYRKKRKKSHKKKRYYSSDSCDSTERKNSQRRRKERHERKRRERERRIRSRSRSGSKGST